MDQQVNLTALKVRYAILGFIVALILGGIFVIVLAHLQAQVLGRLQRLENAASVISQENCTNGVDDNDNGFIDCADSQCGGHSACQPLRRPEICSNGLDDDANGLVDCADPTCAVAANCVTGTTPPPAGKRKVSQ